MKGQCLLARKYNKKKLKKGISDQNKTLKIWKNIATAFQNNLYDALHRLHHPLAFFNTFCKERTEIFLEWAQFDTTLKFLTSVQYV